MKTCTLCGEGKPSTEFYTELRNKDQLTSRCKECHKSVAKSARAKPRIRASLLVGGARHRAQAKGLPFELDNEWALERLLAGVCEVTGKEFCLKPPARGASRNLWSPSIDRVDSSLGYTRENSQMVVTGYNLLKGDCSEDDARRFLSE